MNQGTNTRAEKVSILSGDEFEQAYRYPNYLIEWQDGSNICAIYFSSSGIYFPNTLEEFHKAFFEEDRYEWYETRLACASKHIFVRDIAKQFYITGINDQIDTLDKLIDFLRQHVKGYRVITVGSSAGAYAATVVGIALGAELIFCFSGYFNLNVLDNNVWPYIQEYSGLHSYRKWYDIHDLIKNCSSEIVYFYPTNNREDALQSSFVKSLCSDKFHIYACESYVHGIPFKKKNLARLFDYDIPSLKSIFRDFDKRVKANRVSELEQVLKTYNNVIIFGAGKDGVICLDMLRKNRYNGNIVFWDNDSQKQGTLLCNIRVSLPAKITDISTLILIANRKNGDEIQQQLVDNHYGEKWAFMEDFFCTTCQVLSELLDDRENTK